MLKPHVPHTSFRIVRLQMRDCKCLTTQKILKGAGVNLVGLKIAHMFSGFKTVWKRSYPFDVVVITAKSHKHVGFSKKLKLNCICVKSLRTNKYSAIRLPIRHKTDRMKRKRAELHRNCFYWKANFAEAFVFHVLFDNKIPHSPYSSSFLIRYQERLWLSYYFNINLFCLHDLPLLLPWRKESHIKANNTQKRLFVCYL